MSAKCTFCSAQITPSRDYRKVEGFERKRDGGGTNAIRLRVVKDEWACMHCIDRQTRDHVNVHQDSLL
jgi:hypothetical protein